MLEHYHAMVRLSRQMLEAARGADWTKLVALGQQRDLVEAQLQGVPIPDADSTQGQLMVAALLAANEQIQQLVDAHLASLQAQADQAAAPPP